MPPLILPKLTLWSTGKCFFKLCEYSLMWYTTSNPDGQLQFILNMYATIHAQPRRWPRPGTWRCGSFASVRAELLVNTLQKANHEILFQHLTSPVSTVHLQATSLSVIFNPSLGSAPSLCPKWEIMNKK